MTRGPSLTGRSAVEDVDAMCEFILTTVFGHTFSTWISCFLVRNKAKSHVWVGDTSLVRAISSRPLSSVGPCRPGDQRPSQLSDTTPLAQLTRAGTSDYIRKKET